MRLICPNCSAQYEIDASLIPDEGRDVQCSNCGHTWFELPPATPGFSEAPPPEVETSEIAAEDMPPEEPARRTTMAEAHPVRDEPAEPEDEPQPEPEDEPTPEPADEPADDEGTPEPAEEPQPRGEDTPPSAAARAFTAASEKADEDTPNDDPFAAAAAAGTQFERRRAVDKDALEILRQEAEREITRRRAPPSAPIETQTDMPLDPVQRRNTPSRALRARMARSDEKDEREAEEPKKKAATDPRVQSVDEGYEAPRKDLLPDIDEINSSLKARKRKDDVPAEADTRRGFRAGFLTMVVLAVVLILAYAWAPDIAAAVPALEPALLAYVDWANGARDWIDGLIGA